MRESFSSQSAQQFPSPYSSENVIFYQLSVRKTLIQRCTLYAVVIYFRFRSVHLHLGSSSSVVRRQPSSVVFSSSARLQSVVRSFIYRLLQPSFDRSTSPLDYDIARGSHANSFGQVPLQSCRELCIVLSSAGLKKTTPSPSTLGSNYH